MKLVGKYQKLKSCSVIIQCLIYGGKLGGAEFSHHFRMMQQDEAMHIHFLLGLPLIVGILLFEIETLLLSRF